MWEDGLMMLHTLNVSPVKPLKSLITKHNRLFASLLTAAKMLLAWKQSQLLSIRKDNSEKVSHRH